MHWNFPPGYHDSLLGLYRMDWKVKLASTRWRPSSRLVWHSQHSIASQSINTMGCVLARLPQQLRLLRLKLAIIYCKHIHSCVSCSLVDASQSLANEILKMKILWIASWLQKAGKLHPSKICTYMLTQYTGTLTQFFEQLLGNLKTTKHLTYIT